MINETTSGTHHTMFESCKKTSTVMSDGGSFHVI